MARGKRYREAYEKIDRTRAYAPAKAIALLKQAGGAKFDETVELHIRLGVNVRHAEEQLRGTLALPKGLGKDVTIAVFAEGDAAPARPPRREPTSSAATISPSASRVAGPTSMSPSPIPRRCRRSASWGASSALRARCRTRRWNGHRGHRQGRRRGEGGQGRVPDRQAGDRAPGDRQTSFSETDLLENYAAVIEEIIRAKPAAAKGRYILSATLTTTMGPGIRVDSSRTRRGEIMQGAGAGAAPPAAAAAEEAPQAAEEPVAETPADPPRLPPQPDPDRLGFPECGRERRTMGRRDS